MPDRWERVEAEVREVLGDETSVWNVSRSRWLDAVTPVQRVRRLDNPVRKELLRKRRLLLVR
jgi:hypothetical protein